MSEIVPLINNVNVSIYMNRLVTPTSMIKIGNAFEEKANQITFDFNGSWDGLEKTIVFITPKNVKKNPRDIVNDVFLVTSDILDGAGTLHYTIYGSVSQVFKRNVSGTFSVGAAQTELGGTSSSAFTDIVSDSILATEESVIQTGLCLKATEDSITKTQESVTATDECIGVIEAGVIAVNAMNASRELTELSTLDANDVVERAENAIINYNDITSVVIEAKNAALSATSASIAQTGLCEAATASAVEIVETVQGKIDRGEFVGEQGERGDPGSPKGAFATKALLTSSYPTGNANIYVVTADGGWYYWSGAEWVKGGLYQSAVYDVLNRCINPLPSSLTGFSFTLSNGSYDATDANDKHIKFTATALYGQFTLSDPAVVADFKGHKIYVAAEVKTTAANTTFMLHNGGAIQDSLIVPVSIDGGYSRVSKIISYSLTANAFLLRVIDYRNTGWTEISAKKFMYVDLTAKFGAGNEPSVEIFEKYVEYINNGSSFISGYVASVAAAKAYYSETSGRSLTANSIENSNILEYVENIINVYGVMSNKRICRTSVRKFGQNNIWMMHSIAYKEAIELETFATGTEFGGDTDWIGPYQVASLLNGDGNTVGFTGGNHKYPNIDGNIDANTISCDIYLDGKLITEYGTYNGKETVIQIHNQIMGYNTVSLGRYILDERVTYTIYNNKIDVDVRIIPLEDVSISLYYGMQVPSVNLFSAIHFVGGIVDSPQIIGDLSSGPYNTNFIDSVVFASEEVSLAEHLDNTVSLGLRDHIRSTDPCFLTNPQKAYAQLITTAHTFVQYEKLAWRGYYQINDII